jgi:hypothetical protein
MLASAVALEDARVSVQDAARTAAREAGLGYNWQKSFDQTNPACRTWVNTPPARSVPFAVAIQQILDPVGLRYEVENGEVVLYRAADPLSRKITYLTAQKSVQYVGDRPGATGRTRLQLG